MNRKSFLRNLFGAAVATAVGSKLDFVADLQNEVIASHVKYQTFIDAYGREWTFVHNPMYDDPQLFDKTPSMESFRMVFLDFSQE